MDPAVPAGAALVNDGHRSIGRRLLAIVGVPEPFLAALDDPSSDEVTAIEGRLDLRRTFRGDERVLVDGSAPGLDDIEPRVLLAGVRAIAVDRGDLEADEIDGLGLLLEDAASTPAATRLRLLLEDYLTRPEARSVVVDRLRRAVARERRRDRDVDSLFGP